MTGVQQCRLCNQLKKLEDFHKNKINTSGLDYRCKQCKKLTASQSRLDNYFKCYISTKKAECKTKGIPFNLTPEYLESLWTGVCPIFDIEITYGSKGRGSYHRTSAHLDRINPSLGYVKGNVCWISGRANRIKYDATIDELKKITHWMEQQ